MMYGSYYSTSITHYNWYQVSAEMCSFWIVFMQQLQWTEAKVAAALGLHPFFYLLLPFRSLKNTDVEPG